MGETEYNFFRNATLAISSSLDIEKALQSLLSQLCRTIPGDELLLSVFDSELGAIRRIAHVSNSAPPQREVIIPLPGHLAERLVANNRRREPRLVNDPQLDPLLRDLTPYVKHQGLSAIHIHLWVEDQSLGLLILRARGNNRFSQEHVHLLSSVKEPIAIAMANALQHQELLNLKEQLKAKTISLKEELQNLSASELIGGDGGLGPVMEMVRQIAPLSNTVLLLGETGVGKEVVANSIHELSSRRNGPFIKVNCGAIPENLIDSELFGHEKGAFSGAVSRKPGRFERAHRGTIFLDELGELPAHAQVRLLRVLQENEIERVGGTASIPVDIRVIAATNSDLDAMVADNKFREDLWFRLNAFPIVIPPLRQRKQDIPALLKHLVAKKAKLLGFRQPPPIAPEAIAELTDYNWPGNVRELENVVERALIQNRGRTLRVGPLNLSQTAREALKSHGENSACVFPCLAQRSEERLGLRETPSGPLKLDDAMADHIRKVLKKADGKVHGPDGAAELLGLNPSTLRNKMKKLGIPFGREAKSGEFHR